MSETNEIVAKVDIVNRLDKAFYEAAVCHCGSRPGQCDNHDFSWMEDEHSKMLDDARHEIVSLRKALTRHTGAGT